MKCDTIDEQESEATDGQQEDRAAEECRRREEMALSSGARMLSLGSHCSNAAVSREGTISSASTTCLNHRSTSSITTAAAPATSPMQTRRQRPGRPSTPAAAALLQNREFFLGSNHKIEMRRAGSTIPHAPLNCRAVADRREGVTLDDVPHLSEWLPDLPRYPNPLQDNPAYKAVTQYFVEDDDIVPKNVLVKMSAPSEGIYFRRAGPRENVCFTGDEVRACIVTCGGLCPGLNTVIREIVCGLWTNYGVRDIVGIDGGYQGFYSSNTIKLTPTVVNDIHKRGGTILDTSRGGYDTTKIVAGILDRGINQVYLIGGDGTQRGAALIHEELKRLGVKVVVVGIPKTSDNDVAVIDKSFGFDTAVEEAQRAINAAHVEAESIKNGVGFVKLMGRYSGYIAVYATLASRDVDCCLIPEVPFHLEGKGGLYEFARSRLRENGHMVIVVSEGAGQDLVAKGGKLCRDESGNQIPLDVGLWLSKKLKDHFAVNPKDAICLKYIDPSCMLRATSSNASDNVYCTLLAHSAMHGAMAGYTGFVVGPVNGRHAYIPIARVIDSHHNVDVTNRMWARLLSATQQPDFMEHHHDTVEEEKKRVITEAHAIPQAKHTSGAITQENKAGGGILAHAQLKTD